MFFLPICFLLTALILGFYIPPALFPAYLILLTVLVLPVMGTGWLIRDGIFRRLIKKELKKYGYSVLTVKDTGKQFNIPENFTKGWRRFITLTNIRSGEITSFREVVFSNGTNTAICLAAIKTAPFKKNILSFNVDVGQVFTS